MLHTYEMEIFPEEGGFVAEPFDMPGATEGDTFGEAEMMAADWLKTEMEHRDMNGIPFPSPTFGNTARHPGGRVVCFAVVAGRDTVEKVSASEAARRLNVTPARVTQMLVANQLAGWRDGPRTWVTVDSINARLAEHPRPGRPSRSPKAAKA